MAGGHHIRNCIKGCSIKKVENTDIGIQGRLQTFSVVHHGGGGGKEGLDKASMSVFPPRPEVYPIPTSHRSSPTQNTVWGSCPVHSSHLRYPLSGCPAYPCPASHEDTWLCPGMSTADGHYHSSKHLKQEAGRLRPPFKSRQVVSPGGS